MRNLRSDKSHCSIVFQLAVPTLYTTLPYLPVHFQPNMSSAAGTIAPAHRVGPDYRPDAQKPTATISTQISYDNVHILPQTSQLLALLTYASPSLADIPLQSKLESSPLQDDPGQGLSVSSVLERLNVLPARSASDKWRNDHLSRSGNNLLRSNKPLI